MLVSESPRILSGDFVYTEISPYLSRIQRADERTRTADLLQLRVITHSLQGFAGACKSPIFRRLSLLWVAACCTVLRSRWYQSGINITHVGEQDPPGPVVTHGAAFFSPRRASILASKRGSSMGLVS